jgi:hypothetical protein
MAKSRPPMRTTDDVEIELDQTLFMACMCQETILRYRVIEIELAPNQRRIRLYNYVSGQERTWSNLESTRSRDKCEMLEKVYADPENAIQDLHAKMIAKVNETNTEHLANVKSTIELIDADEDEVGSIAYYKKMISLLTVTRKNLAKHQRDTEKTITRNKAIVPPIRRNPKRKNSKEVLDPQAPIVTAQGYNMDYFDVQEESDLEEFNKWHRRHCGGKKL